MNKNISIPSLQDISTTCHFTSFSTQLAIELNSIDLAVTIQFFINVISNHKRMGRNLIEGKTWNYCSVEQLIEYFPFWTQKQIRLRIESLVKLNILMVGNHNKLKIDRTLWYAFSDEKKWGLDKIKPINLNNNYDLPKWENGFIQMGKPIPYTNNIVLQENKEINKESPKSKPKPEISEQALQLANIFFESFEKNITEVKTKPKKVGIEKFDKLLKNYSFDEVVKVIEYAHTNNFWKPIILSINKLFDKFETLKVQSQNQTSYKTKSKVEPLCISAQFEGMEYNANREHMPTLDQKNLIRTQCGLGPITAEEYEKELDEVFGK